MTAYYPPSNTRLRRQCLFLRLGGLTYLQIGEIVGLTRQRVHQLTSPSAEARAAVVAYACTLCDMCGAQVGASGQIHHRSTEVDPSDYNAPYNLSLLCRACHRTAHASPVVSERNRPRTAEEKVINQVLKGERTAATRHGMTLDEYRAKRAEGVNWCSYHKTWEPVEGFYRRGVCLEGNRQRSSDSSRRLTLVGRNPSIDPVTWYRVAAARLRIPYDEYRTHIDTGESWCGGHKCWHPIADFGKNTRRPNGRNFYCLAFDRARTQARKAAAS